ncbi:NUDIX hydrolase [Patulibacter sp.]|uniref:NUDIX hydrolase n=1 Tax=Patulibacter sp. TaxID=1912859 RepID=UPI00271754BE|nr:NUDIX hydrolase [Patulibacter sp.]MDO9407619.1 NUDIX hydrolase [Patulibacter sp.]
MTDTPVIPKMAAAVVVVRDGPDGLEVLVGQRTSKAKFMGGFWVFPGGRVEPGDGDGEAAWPVAAAREVREEVGIAVPAEELRIFDRWVTPEALPRRYDTVFFLARAPRGAEAQIDGEEIVDSRWATPDALLHDAQEGRAILAFPTLRQLEALAPHASVDDALAACPGAMPDATLPVLGEHEGDPVLSIPGPDGGLVHYRSGEIPAGERPPGA